MMYENKKKKIRNQTQVVRIISLKNNIKKKLSGCQPVFDKNANVFR